MFNPENPCVRIGCPAACCRNCLMELSDMELRRFIPGGTILVFLPKYQFEEMKRKPPESVGPYEKANILYAARDYDGGWQLIFDGLCPHQTDGFACDDYARRPECCHSTVFLDPLCLETRQGFDAWVSNSYRFA